MIYRKNFDPDGNMIKPLKPWLREVRSMLLEYKDKRGDEIDNLITDLNLEDRFFTNKENEFTESEKLLAQQLIELMEFIFGSYTIKKLLTGTLYIDEHGIQFTIVPWRKLHQIYTYLGISLPHNKFTGIVGERTDRGISSEITIKKFIIDSIISPWKLSNLLSISSAPVSTFFTQFKTSVESQFQSTFYSYVSELSFERYLDWSKENNLLDRDRSIGRLAKMLSEELKTQIYRSHLSPTSSSFLSRKEVLRYQRFAIECVYDVLFAVDAAAIEQRKKLYTFLSTEGREEVTIDFSSGRQGFPFGGRGSLHSRSEFFELTLSWEDYMSTFYKDGPSIANALPFSLVAKTYDTFIKDQRSSRFLPHTMLRNRQEFVIQIADFLKYIAKEYGDIDKPIRIYGYKEGANGFGNRKPFTYSPTHESPVLDREMPSNNEFYYEIDPNNLDAFSLEHFRVFLGALFADHQGFFVRTEDMPAGQFLFAFNLFGVLERSDITINPSSKYIRPTTPSIPINFGDPSAFSDLSDMWSSIVSDMRNDNLLATMHRYSDIEDWHTYLKLLPMLNELKSSFDFIGDFYSHYYF